MDIKAQFEALSQSAYLEVQLPKATDFDAAAFLRNGAADDLTRVSTRRNVFFDEQASILVILRSTISEAEVHDILPHLELVLVAHATDAVPQGSGNAASASGKHDLSSKSLPGTTFVDVVSLEGNTYVIWKPTLHLSRPRARLQRPAIYFTANITIARNSSRGARQPQKEYLESFEPLPANVLEPLRFDPALTQSDVFLPETRITRVAPKAEDVQDTVKPIRGASKRAFPAVPALFSRIQYSSLPDAIVASLYLETSQVIAGTVTIDKITVDIPEAQIQHLTNDVLPLETRAGDETLMLYKVTQMASQTTNKPAGSLPVSVAISAYASLDQGTRIAFDISLQTQLDISPTTTSPAYTWARPTSAASHQRGLSGQSFQGKVSFDSSPKQAQGEAFVTFSFTGPATTSTDSEFQIDVHCNNRSGRPRRFALFMLQPRKPRATTLSSAQNASSTDLVENVFGAPLLERSKAPDVLDLNTDVRVGPLPTGTCYETHMKFRATCSGALDLGVLRILDLDTRQTVDVRELPDVVALDQDRYQERYRRSEDVSMLTEYQ